MKGEIWEQRSNGTWLRTITAFDQLYDVSPVYQPAYEGTVVDRRGMEALQRLEDGELKYYFNNLRKKFNK